MPRTSSTLAIAVIALFAATGCLSGGVPGGTGADTTTTWPAVPADSECSPPNPTNETTATNSSKQETLSELPSGPVHLRIENVDTTRHDVGVSVSRPDGDTVFTGTVELGGGDEVCVPDAIPRPDDGSVSYEVSVTVDGAVVDARTYSVGAGMLEVQVFVEDADRVRFGRVLN